MAAAPLDVFRGPCEVPTCPGSIHTEFLRSSVKILSAPPLPCWHCRSSFQESAGTVATPGMGWSSAKWLGTLFSLQAPLSLASTGKINAHQPAQKSFVHVCKQRQLCTPMREQQQTMCGQQQTMHEQQQAMSG